MVVPSLYYTTLAALARARCATAPGKIAVLTSFGTESALLLDLVAGIDRAMPVLFLDTGRHFPQTLSYRDALIDRLGLRNVRCIRPLPADYRDEDADGTLWQRDPGRCCALRKVRPLDRALLPFDLWITGRRRAQSTSRQGLAYSEAVGQRVRLNPLAHWTDQDVEAAIRARGLPAHPLQVEGYRSIGCAPCTAPVAPGEAARAGRWPGVAKTECGIHGPDFVPHLERFPTAKSRETR